MKKFLALVLSFAMIFGIVGCGKEAKQKPETVGGVLLENFKADTKGTTQEIADRLLGNEVIAFQGASAPVEPGFLAGFDSAEITGFKEGTVFMPMINTIPFIGYVFEVEEDAEAFMDTLKDNANLRWNICTEAEEMVVEAKDNKVFFVMSPKSFEDPAE